MRRRDFLTASSAMALLASTRAGATAVHNFDGYDFGPGPTVTDRLYQGPFPTDRFAGWQVVMATTASKEIIPGFGMGLVTYLCDEVGPPSMPGETLAKSLEELARFPLGTKLYLRVNWKDVQSKPGRLDLCEHWKIAFDLARRYDKRLGLRVMMSNPDIEGSALPAVLAKKVPMVELGEWLNRRRFEPRYDHPAFQSAFNELTGLLAEAYDGHSQVEYVDTAMYGFWGEGHTWPLERNPFPDYATAEATWVRMFETQLAHWKKTPLTTNTQPDFSKVGNFELLERTVRSHEWLRTDTIFIENEQIEALSNRPAWCGVTVEVPNADGSAESLHLDQGVTLTDNVIGHVRDVGACYFSLWNWHRIRADRLRSYYEKYPEAIDSLARNIGYRVRPSWIYTYDAGGDADRNFKRALQPSLLRGTGHVVSPHPPSAGPVREYGCRKPSEGSSFPRLMPRNPPFPASDQNSGTRQPSPPPHVPTANAPTFELKADWTVVAVPSPQAATPPGTAPAPCAPDAPGSSR